MKEKKARVEDALHATRAAVEEGIVPGGGVALLRAASGARRAQARRATRRTGVRLVRRAIEEPLRQIAQNAGAEGLGRGREGARGQGRASASTPRPSTYEDLLKAGVIDPAKVVRIGARERGQRRRA